MKPGDLEYQALVQKIMDENRAASFSQARRMVSQAGDKMHKHTQLTESECKSEVAEILGGAKSSFDYPREMQDKLMSAIIDDAQTAGETPVISTIIAQAGKKRRGRPPGSKSKKKNVPAP